MKKEPGMINKAFGMLIVRMRKERGLTQEVLAWGLGSSNKYMSDVELGKRNVSLNYADRVAQYFGVSLGDLLQEAYDLALTMKDETV